MQENIENVVSVQGVNFQFIDLITNSGTKYLLFFDNSCEKPCNSKVFVDIATAAINCGLSSI